LIARQRSVLNRTFVHEQDARVSDEVARRLVKSQEELAAATGRFSQGIAQRGEPIPAVDEAVRAMILARDALRDRKLSSARPHEETALACLVGARQNLRKLLSQSNQQQASACCSFDRQQRQEIRRPPQDEKKQQLANLESDLRKLAQQERAFSEEIQPRSRSSQPREAPRADDPRSPGALDQTSPPSSQPGSPAAKPATPSRSATRAVGTPPASTGADPATRQCQAAAEAERLRDLAQGDESLTDRTRQRLAAVAGTVRESAREIQAGQEAEAAAHARAAAEQLQRLARQVGALKTRELADQIARTRDLARALAADQTALEQALRTGRPGQEDKVFEDWAKQVRSLAEEIPGLGDLLDRIRGEAGDESPQLARDLGQLTGSNPVREIEGLMRQGAAAAEAGRPSEAQQAGEGAARRLSALAQDLEAARRSLVQPLLDRFLAAEKQAASTQEQLRSARSGAQQAQAERALANLARSLDGLASPHEDLRAAADRLDRALRAGAGVRWHRDEPSAPDGSSLFVPPTDLTDSVRAVVGTLQSRIQQLVRDRALMERDGAVPPRYKSLVEDYYRILSQDLR
jgi:hypothetical protein